jgi:molybdate transport system substrate-binding protein
LALLCAACSRAPQPSAPSREVVVFAATSLRDVLEEVAPAFERAHGGRVVHSFGASGDLARQIVAAGGVDVFVSADEAEMDRLSRAGTVVEGTRRDVAANQLVVVEPASAAPGVFHAPFTAAQLAALERISLGNPATAPVGRYAQAWLEAQGIWERVEPRVIRAQDARAALAQVESGACAAGIVYATDAQRSTRVRVVHRVAPADGPRIAYPAAALGTAKQPGLAREYVQFLSGPQAQAALARRGFAPPGP